jgi:hypothetical protein
MLLAYNAFPVMLAGLFANLDNGFQAENLEITDS